MADKQEGRCQCYPNGTSWADPACAAKEPHRFLGHLCHREPGHPGPHRACLDGTVIAEWGQAPPAIEETILGLGGRIPPPAPSRAEVVEPSRETIERVKALMQLNLEVQQAVKLSSVPMTKIIADEFTDLIARAIAALSREQEEERREG